MTALPAPPSPAPERTPAEALAARAPLRILIAAVGALILIDVTPSLGAVHDSLRQGIDPIMDVTGLWQGTWQLFAPNVDKMNVRVEAEIVFSDGQRAVWHSPDWPRLSSWQRFVLFRHQEYYDNIRLDDSKLAWRPLARHLARTVSPPLGGDAVPERVTLKRVWAQIPKLEAGAEPVPPGPYERFDREFTFYTWTPGAP